MDSRNPPSAVLRRGTPRHDATDQTETPQISFYSVSDKTCLLAGAEQEGPAHNPWSTQGPHPVDGGNRDYNAARGRDRIIVSLKKRWAKTG